MAKVATVSVDFRANTATFQRNLRTASNAVNSSQARMNRATALMQRSFAGVQRSVTNLTGGLGGLRGALAAVLGGAGLAALARQALQAADSIADTADKLGIAVDSLQELRYAAEQSGVATATFDTALRRFIRRSAEAAQGTGVAKDALEQMGIALRDSSGNMRAAEDMLADVADAFQEIEDPAERVRIAFQLFDSEGSGLVNMLNNGAAGMAQMRARARELGLVMDQELIRRTAAFNDQLSDVLQLIRTNFQAGLLDGLIGDAEALTTAFEDAQVADALRDIGEAIGMLGRIGMEVLPVIIRNFESLLAVGTALVGARLGARIGALLGPLGALVGGGIGAAAGALATYQMTAEQTISAQERLNAATREYNDIIGNATASTHDMVRAQRELEDAQRALAIEEQNARWDEAVAEIERVRGEIIGLAADLDGPTQSALVTFANGMVAVQEQLRQGEISINDAVAAFGRLRAELRETTSESDTFYESASRLGAALASVISLHRSIGDRLRELGAVQVGVDVTTVSRPRPAADPSSVPRSSARSSRSGPSEEERAAERRRELIEEMERQMDAAQRLHAATLRGAEAVAALNRELEIEQNLRQLGSAANEEEIARLTELAGRTFDYQQQIAMLADAQALIEQHDPFAAQAMAIERLNMMMPALIELTGDAAEAQRIYNLEVERIEEGLAQGVSMSEQFASVMGQGLKSLITGTDDWQSALSNVLNRLFDIATELLVIQPLVAALGGGGSGGNIFGALLGGITGGFGGGFGGLYADGGRPPVGRLSIVGERGPELFVPSVPGTIVPNEDLMGGPAGGPTIVQHLNFSLGVQSTVRAEIRNAMPQIAEAAAGAVANQASRGGRYADRLRGR